MVFEGERDSLDVEDPRTGRVFKLTAGSEDPSAAGVRGELGDLFLRSDGSLWQKTGTANTAWTMVSGASTTDTSISYANVAGTFTTTQFTGPGYSTGDPSETNRQAAMTRSGVIKNMFVRVGDDQTGGDSHQFTLRINGAPSGLQVVIVGTGNNPATGSDTANTANVNQGDLVSIEYVLTGANAVEDVSISFELES